MEDDEEEEEGRKSRQVNRKTYKDGDGRVREGSLTANVPGGRSSRWRPITLRTT